MAARGEMMRDADINRLDRTHHVAGAIRFQEPRTLKARGVVPYVSPPKCLVPYIREAGFGGPCRWVPLTTTCLWFPYLLRGGNQRRTVSICRGGSARSRRGIPSRTPHGRKPDQWVCAGLPDVVWHRDLGHGPGISRGSSPGRGGEELRRGEADDVPAAATQAREPIVLPHDAPARGRRARMQRPNIR
ncbi:hypothetical protein PIB30_036950 [Stylosanthes scabra]|uniref:Uncharacterized protein n=1 Tax=Stylosanthes scabra TaxID=79078 RepID=A0ABU6VCW1_9FABA|nr:hypothetical protein [Stylosanthes scabra]